MKKTLRLKLSADAAEVYRYFCSKRSKIACSNGKRTKEIQILETFEKKKELIKANFHYGEPIAKKKIPLRYHASNLFWVELPHFWRFLYTLVNGDSEIEIIAFVLDIIDHKKYNKVFGYKKN